MREVCVVPTYRRTELLHGCLRRLRGQDGDVPIVVFSDRGETSPELDRNLPEIRGYTHPAGEARVIWGILSTLERRSVSHTTRDLNS